MVGGGKEPTLEVEEMTSGDGGWREGGSDDETISSSDGDNGRLEVKEEEKKQIRYDITQLTQYYTIILNK